MSLGTKAELMSITLPLALEGDLMNAARQVSSNDSHYDQCEQAAALATQFVPDLRGLLAPVLEGDNFAYLVTQAPVAELAARGTSNGDHLRSTMKVRTLGMTAALGTQAVTEVEGDGNARLSRVTPQPGMERTQTSRGSLDPLEPHQEQIPDAPGPTSRSVHDTKMEFSLLACVANEAGVVSQYSPLADALAVMQEQHSEAAKQLWLPKFRLDPFDSNPLEKASGMLRTPEPIVRFRGGAGHIR